eukprot:900854-Alexandrium_andersonii.AAC.1
MLRTSEVGTTAAPQTKHVAKPGSGAYFQLDEAAVPNLVKGPPPLRSLDSVGRWRPLGRRTARRDTA